MIQVQLRVPQDLQDAREQLQTAIGVEFGTLPPYLYAMFSIPPGANERSAALIRSVLMEEMVHLCLVSNILNALGGSPQLVPPSYPGYLPGHIGPDGNPLKLHLLPFSRAAMQQGMNIEQPESPPEFPVAKAKFHAAMPAAVTIGQFYEGLDKFLATLPPEAWHRGRNQLDDRQFLAGELFAVNTYADAHRAIKVIVSEGEGTGDNPLDFADQVAHYFRFGEIFRDKVLTKISQEPGYQWGPEALGVAWDQVYPAIPDPQTHDFSTDPPDAQSAQRACNQAYSEMIDALRLALNGQPAQFGVAVRAMFDLSMAARLALNTSLADGTVSGPAFLYVPQQAGATS